MGRLDGSEDAERADRAADRAEDAAEDAEESARVATDAAAAAVDDEPDHDFLHDPEPSDPEDELGTPGRPLNHRSPFLFGLMAGLGAMLAYWLAGRILDIGPILVLIVVAMFLAVGLNPLVEFLMRRGLRRSWSVLIVIVGVLAALTLFVLAVAPIVGDQAGTIKENAPGWLDQLTHSRTIQRWDDQYDLIQKAKDYIESGDLAQQAAGGVLGFGVKVLSILGNTFVVVVLMLYFLASLPTVKRGIYQLAPASRRPRVALLGDQILKNIGGYVSGAFVVATCAGITTLVFLLVVGLGEYAVALALVVALLDVIPMIGATLGAVVVCAIGFATDVRTGVICVIFYVVYQQFENYVIYPRVMSRSVDIPGAVTVIAALVGASLLGVIGALLAIPVAAAGLLLVNEVFLPRQDAH